MPAQLLDGIALSKKIRAEIAARGAIVTAKGRRPGLAVIIVGDNQASQVYVRNKVKACEDVGFYSVLERYSVNLGEEELLARIATLNADPAIRQGVQFLNDERSVLNKLMPNLNLISQTDDAGIGSGKIIKGKILEGLTTTNATTQSGPAPASTPSTTTAQSSPAAASTTSTTNTQSAQSKVISQQMIDSLNKKYQYTLDAYNKNLSLLSTDAGGGIASNNEMISISPDASLPVGKVRSVILGLVNDLRNNLDSVYNQITQATNTNVMLSNEEYNDIMMQLNGINAEIINNYQLLNKYENSVDYISPLAGAEETSTLSNQRYYVYILWFIITVIVLYITISNLINPSSSTWSLAISLILLIGLFAFLVYNNIGTWYTKVDDDIRSLQLPSFNNLFNFDPLVSIKYTS